MPDKAVRRQRIRELLAREQVHSQDQLQKLLRADRIAVTQATLSRDLRDMGVAKTPTGYQLPGNGAAGLAAAAPAELDRILPGVVLAAEHGGNLIILHTEPGHANALASDLDRARLDDVLGTVAGDDTIFIAVRTETHARKLLRRLRKMARLN